MPTMLNSNSTSPELDRSRKEQSKMSKAFELIHKATSKHDWGYVEGAGVPVEIL